MKDKSQALVIGERLPLACRKTSFEGKGVCFAGDIPVFVPSMYPGDEGLVEVSYKRNGAYFGILRSLQKPSSARIDPVCPIATSCGGCAFQAISYEEELRLKREMVREQLFRQGIDVPVLPTMGGDPKGYRNKVAVPFGKDERGELVYGFYREKSHHIVPNENCAINDPRADALLRKLLSFLREEGVTPYDEERDEGELRHVLIRAMKRNHGLMLVLVLRKGSLLLKPGFIKRLSEAVPEVTSCYANINPKRTNVILGDTFIHLFGDRFVYEELGGLRFRISPNSFIQVNSMMAERLYETAVSLGGVGPEDTVFDAYSGTGAIGLFAAKKAKAVEAVELISEAVEDATENAVSSDIHNYKAYVGDATEWMRRMAKEGRCVDVLFTDPPRKGCTPEFLEAAMDLSPRKIVYVSCNPISLARDLKFLLGAYEISKCQPVDMFPRTPHVETVVSLVKDQTKVARLHLITNS